MKKLINEPASVVPDALRGLVGVHPELAGDPEAGYVWRAQGPKQGRVALVSGGGSGHEPLHAGFVGHGMLDAACPGEIFTSPVPDQIINATARVDGGAGVLHVVKNYTGDVLNFEMAAELAAEQDIEVASVLVADDVAVEDSTFTAGRRGTGTTLFVEKIAGALAEEGADLASVAAVAREVTERSRSFGMALTPCVVPASGRPGFELGPEEVELGIGIHGEPGRERATIGTAAETVDTMLAAIHADMPLESPQTDEVLLLVNGMGATPLIELYIVYDEVRRWLADRGVRVARCLVGNYVTSLDMAGCSLTVCRLTPELARLWDAPVQTPALRWGR